MIEVVAVNLDGTLEKSLSMPLDSFTIRVEEDNISAHSICESDNYYFRQYYIVKGCKIAVCSRKNEFLHEVKIINVNDQYEEFFCYE